MRLKKEARSLRAEDGDEEAEEEEGELVLLHHGIISPRVEEHGINHESKGEADRGGAILKAS